MSRHKRGEAVALSLAAVLVVGASVVVRAEFAVSSLAVPAATTTTTSASAEQSPTVSPTPAPSPTVPAAGSSADVPTAVPSSVRPTSTAPVPPASSTRPPATKTPTPKPSPKPSASPTPGPGQTTTTLPRSKQIRIADRYLSTYGARRTSWDTVVDSGRRLPGVTSKCAKSWRSSGRDSRLSWGSVPYLCLNGLQGRAYKPQGVGGSATTERYLIDGAPAANRNLVVTSWYSEAQEPGLFAPNHGGQSVTRLVVMDLDRARYNKIELVRPDGSRHLRNLDSHGSGVVWAGQYLYTSSRGVLWMYNADDIVKIRGHYVLPAIARWTVHGRGGLSSISIDRSTSPARLTGINYSKSGQAYIQSFELDANGLLAPNSRRADHDLYVTNKFGDRHRTVHSTSSLVVRGSSFQGVASSGAYGFANSSALHISGRVIDATVVLKHGKVIERFRMPKGNGESIFIDYRRRTFTSITEHGSQFLYQLPLNHLTEVAER